MKWLTKLAARPRLEELESRDVPSYLAAEFPGHGVWLYNSAGGTWQQVTAANASQAAADSNGDVVGEFPGQGVWLDKGGAWQQINGHDAASLAIAYSYGLAGWRNNSPLYYINIYVAAEIPGYWVCRYTDSTQYVPNDYSDHNTWWAQLTANNASTEAVDTYGDLVAEFPGQGVWFCPGTTAAWMQLTASNATSLALGDNLAGYYSPGIANVVAEFPGYGVWRFQVNPWTNVTTGLQQLTANNATTVGVNATGDVVAEFPGWGVWSYTDSPAATAAGWAAGWNHLTAADAALVGIDAVGNAYGQFGVDGLWYDQVYSWRTLTANNASSFGVGA